MNKQTEGETRENALVEADLAETMRGALDEGQFTVFFQPQFNHTNGMIVGAEALARWNHPQRGLVTPPEFIPVFERTGLITELDAHIFEQVCAFQKDRIDRVSNVVPISVNLTQYDMFAPGFVEKIDAIRESHGVPARYLRIELAENTMLGGIDLVKEILGKFHERGYIIEMDDFGSGYASLNVLKNLDLDVIKIDMEFFDDDGTPQGKRAGIILSSIIDMLGALELPVIAEHVETQEQADLLYGKGCFCVQGFLYAKPMSKDEFGQMLDSSAPSPNIP